MFLFVDLNSVNLHFKLICALRLQNSDVEQKLDKQRVFTFEQTEKII